MTSAVQEYEAYIRAGKYARQPISRKYFSQHIREWYTANLLSYSQAFLDYLDNTDLWPAAYDNDIATLVRDLNFRKCVNEFVQSEMTE
jgi:hypothetical protein